MALPGGEDTGLLIAASVVSDGHFIAAPGLLYRRHSAQITNRETWAGTAEWAARMRLIEARGRALRRFRDAVPGPGGSGLAAMRDAGPDRHS